MQTMPPFSKLREDSNRIGAEFLMTELETAFTFLKLAETTSSEETRERNCRNARAAYDTVLRMNVKVMLGREQKQIVEDKLKELRKILEGYGQSFA